MERDELDEKLGRELKYLNAVTVTLLWACVCAFCWDALGNHLLTAGEDRDLGLAVTLALVPFALAGVLALAYRARGRWLPRLAEALEEHSRAIDDVPDAWVNAAIVLAACLGLFAELAIIRLHASYLQLFAYFKNVSLLSCFLGLGIGYARGRRRLLLTPLVLPLMTVQVLGIFLLSRLNSTAFLQTPVREEAALGFNRYSDVLSGTIASISFLVVVFFYNALCFLPLGQLASRLMSRRDKLAAYSWNLLGSIAGVVLLNVLAFLWAPPAVWFLFVVVMMVPFVGAPRLFLSTTVVVGGILLVGLGWPPDVDAYDVYSPYQKLSVQLVRGRLPEIQVSNVYYQRMLDFSDEGIESDAVLADSRAYYNLPYQFRSAPASVLVVGSGSGNDVASALRHGAGRIDAVEIDPVIYQLGKRLHPAAPYQAPNVRVFLNDARAHLRSTREKYDLIVYGLLDSHSLLTGRTSVRLDSFVYTVEGFREARSRLQPNGLVFISFAILHDDMGRKIHAMLSDAFDGRPPLVFNSKYDAGVSFVAGENLDVADIPGAVTMAHVSEHYSDTAGVDMSTDDWPFFYMPQRRYPFSYVVVMGLLLGVSVITVRRMMPRAGGLSWPCFFLGAGFMLVETKGITELALVYGSTWMVVALVITAILLMAFLANWVVIRFGGIPRSAAYGLLLLALVLGLVLISTPLGLPELLTRLVLTTALTLPLFFSGLAFSAELNRTSSVATALSSNLLGAMLGGFLEYNAMYFGFRFLYFLAMGMYALAWLTAARRPAS